MLHKAIQDRILSEQQGGEFLNNAKKISVVLQINIFKDLLETLGDRKAT